MPLTSADFPHRLRHAAGPRLWCLALCLAFGLAPPARAASGTAYAVQASATAQFSPAQITLSWSHASVAATGYAISRKDLGAASWSPLINLVGSATSHVDTNVTAGRAYEYQIVRQAPGYTGYGYVAAGVDVALPDTRGRVILVIDRSIAGAIAGQIDRLVDDLIGDGWTLTRLEVGRSDAPATVREAIRSAYNEDRSTARAVLLLGHVPVARSGNLNLDNHGARPMPADTYYGDMDGNWADANGDGVFDHNTLPSDVDLMVGRVDFADMPSFGSETDLLRRYLDKNHAFRTGARRVTARALIGDRAGDYAGEAFAASGFRNFAALLGPDRITIANVEDNAPSGERWITRLTTGDWLWVYGAGGGTHTSMSGLGLHGAYDDVWSADLVDQRARGMFYLLFGSWLVDWNQRDNIMRAALAAPDYGLTAIWTGRPHVFLHSMAVGEPIGTGVRLSQNNTTLYTNQVNHATRGIHLTLLGDPTLRMQAVAPAPALQAGAGGASPALTWSASPDASAGYHLYRATTDAGPFTRITASPVTATAYTDYEAPAGSYTYQVRAVRRETTGGGTYLNQSQGTFARATVTNPTTQPTGPTTVRVGVVGSGGTGGSAGGGGGGAHSPVLLGALAVVVLLRWFGRRHARAGIMQ